MAKRLRCRIGRHAWEHKVNDEGQRYKECARCGKCTEEQDVGGSGHWGGLGGVSIN
jgi:hypothetical protein